MKKTLKKYLPDILILGGILLVVTNHFFKITEYKRVTRDLFEDLDFTTTSVNYDYVGFFASVIVIIGLYIVIKKHIKK